MRHVLPAAAALIALVCAAPAAKACTGLIATDPATGETYITRSPDGLRRQQAAWRAEADIIFIAEVREARMVSGGKIEFLLVPIVTIEGDTPPDDTMLFHRWSPGDTCNDFQLNLADFVIVYADMEMPWGWSVVGLTTPALFQEPPPDLERRMRDISRGVIRGPAFPD